MTKLRNVCADLLPALFVLAVLGCESLTAPTKPTSSSSSSKEYYVSANGCTGGDVSYRGYSYETCNNYYRTARNRNCTKIYDNCR